MSATIRRQILSPQQLKRLKDQAQALEARLENKLVIPKHKGIKESGLSERKKGFFEQFLREDVKEDKGIIQRNLKRVRQALHNGAPPPLSQRDRAKREAQMKQQEEYLRKNLTPRALYYAKSNSPEFDQAKKAVAREMTPQMQQVINGYVQNRRALDPGNAERNVVEKLRPNS